MRSSRKDTMKIEVLVVVVLAMLWLTNPIVPSSGQEDGFVVNGGTCWQNVTICVEDHLNQSEANPGLTSSPSFNMSEYLCCPLFHEAAQNDKSCFCYIDTYVKKNASSRGQVTTILSLCKLFDSLTALDAFCSSVDTTPPVSGVTPSPTQGSSAPPPDSSIEDNSTPGQVPGSSTTSGKKNTVVIAIAAASATVLLLFTIGIVFYCTKRKKQVAGYGTVEEDAPPKEPAHQHQLPSAAPTAGGDDIITPESLQYDFGVLKAATSYFSDDHKLGQGGFGVVYKGVLQNGQEIAVKRLSKSSGQGDKEFKIEAAFVAKLQHRNLVRLMGFCLAKEERLLVYEFMRNKSLDYILFDPEKQKQLNWSRRYNIIKGVARGMLYLHEDSPIRIIHRDLKAANVLLDTEMNPKIADFGMARIFQVEQTHAEASRIVGTCGYMAPEYLMHGQISTKSDVYSFGVLVLEIVSGKRISAVICHPGGGENLLSYAWRCLRDRKTMEFMDPTLKATYSEDEVTRCIHIGLLCVQEDMKKRPTMENIALMLNSDSVVAPLSMPQYPAFLFGGSTYQSTSTSAPWSASEPSISEQSSR